MAELERLLYVSRVAAQSHVGDVQRILDVARPRNGALGVTGALLCTGTHFVQWLEGAPAALDMLMASIAADARHAEVAVLLREATSQRRFGAWRMGYVASEGAADLVDALHAGGPVDGARADRLATHLFGAPPSEP